MMGVVGRLGRVLGPARPDAEPEARHRHHGRRPAPCPRARPARSSTASTRTGSSTWPIGKRSFEAEQLGDNATALIDAVMKAKPAATKGIYLKKISISTTMGPGVRIDPASGRSAA